MHAHEAINAIVSTKVNSQAFPDLPEGKESMNDAVNHPKHYTSHPSGIETIEITGKLPFALGNAVKYLMRSQYKKDRIEDLKKARWYLELPRQTLVQGVRNVLTFTLSLNSSGVQ